MEITKVGSRFKLGRIRGGRHKPPPPPGFSPRPSLLKSFTKGYRLGPPPPPGKLFLLNPSENKGIIHQHLQETLKKYAATKHQHSSGPLPIIVKGTGPNPPPPPPGYKLGSPGGPTDNGWIPGPPPLSGKLTGPRSSRLSSMLQNAAHSGIFVSSEFSPGPPVSGTFMTIQPDGTQVTTHVNDNFVPSPPVVLPESGVERQPNPPPVLKVGGALPENYTVLFAQRQIIGLKSPDTLDISGVENSGANEYDIKLNLGTKYEQGYGAKPPPSHPLVITKFQKRGDYEEEPVKTLVTQALPDTGLISTVNLVFSSPNISAPLGGKNSPHFQKALEEKRRLEKQRKKEKPLDAQVKLLGRLFTKLQRLRPPKLAVPEDELEDEKYVESSSSGGGWGWGGEDDSGDWKKHAKSKVDSPIMAVQIQTFSAPEVNSSDPDILESMAEFGSHDVEFADTDELVTLMEKAMYHGSSRIPITDLGSNPQEINDNMLNWVRRHLAITRDANLQAHSKTEELASKQFRQYQTFVTPPFGANGWGPGGPMPVDPKQGRRSFAVAMSNMMGALQAPQA